MSDREKADTQTKRKIKTKKREMQELNQNKR